MSYSQVGAVACNRGIAEALSVAVLSLLQLVDEVGEQLHYLSIAFFGIRTLGGRRAVVAHGMSTDRNFKTGENRVNGEAVGCDASGIGL